MEILVANKIMSMLLACLVGFIIVRAKLLEVDDTKVLSKLLAFICSPCALIAAFQMDFTIDKVKGLLIALVLAILIHIIYIGGTKLLGNKIGLSGIERAAIIYSNAGYLTIPLVSAVLGSEWVFYTCSYSVVQTLLLWTHCKSLISGERVIELKKALLNPNFIAIYAGIIMFITGIRFPSIVDTAITDFSALLGPVSMVIIGMLIGNQDILKMVKAKRVYFICVMRLFVMPIIILALFKVVSMIVSHPELDMIMIIVLWATSGPVGSMVSQLSQIYGDEGEYAGRLNLMSAILCVISLPLITYLFELLI